MYVIVTNDLRDEIYDAIDKALGGRPCDEQSREVIYGQLLAYFNEHGRIPSFTLADQD